MKKNQQVCCPLASPPPYPPLNHTSLPSLISVLLPSPRPPTRTTHPPSVLTPTAAHNRQNRGKLPLPGGMLSFGWLGYHLLTPVGVSGVKPADKEEWHAQHEGSPPRNHCYTRFVVQRLRRHTAPASISASYHPLWPRGGDNQTNQVRSTAEPAGSTDRVDLQVEPLEAHRCAPQPPTPTIKADGWMHPCCRILISISIWISIWISGAILQACMKVRFGRAHKHCLPTPTPPAANGEAKLYSPATSPRAEPATGETPKRPRARLNERGESAAVLADARLCWVASRVGRKQTRAARGRAAAPTTARSKSRVGGCVLGILFALAHTGTSVCQFKINGPNQCEGQGAIEDDCPK